MKVERPVRFVDERHPTADGGYQEHIAVNPSATLNASSEYQKIRPKLEAASANSIGNGLCRRWNSQAGADGSKLPICGSEIRRIFPNANYSNLPLLWQPAVKDA